MHNYRYTFIFIALLSLNLYAKNHGKKEPVIIDSSITYSELSEDEKSTLSKKQKKALKKLEKSKKNFRFTILAGPAYNADFGFILGGSALFTFRTNKEDKEMPRSVLPISFSLYSTGGIKLLSKSELYFRHDRFRIFSEINISTMAAHYYGVGYQRNKNTKRSDSTTFYREQLFQLRPSFAFRVKKTDVFAGPILDISYRNNVDPSIGVYKDPYFKQNGGDSTGITFWNVGIGGQIQFDSRDIASNAYEGLYVALKLYGYFKWLGSTMNFGVVDFEYRHYKELPISSKRKVFAWTVKGRQVMGDAPFTELSTVGSIYERWNDSR